MITTWSSVASWASATQARSPGWPAVVEYCSAAPSSSAKTCAAAAASASTGKALASGSPPGHRDHVRLLGDRQQVPDGGRAHPALAEASGIDGGVLTAMGSPCQKWLMPNRATSAGVARSAGLHRLVDELGDWSAGPGPLFRQLARSLAASIERGAIAPAHIASPPSAPWPPPCP